MQQNLNNAADALGRMIEAARADLAHGRAVDLANIESVATAICRSAAAAPERIGNKSALATRLQSLLNALGALEADLTQRQQLLFGA
jgi:hypothetical protein